MKKLFVTLFLSTFIGAAFAQVPSNGLVSYYPFNGNLTDGSSTAATSTLNAGSANYTTGKDGAVNSAYLVDNTANWIKTSYVGIAGNNERTVNIWVKPTAYNSSEYPILAAYGAYESTGNDIRFGINIAGRKNVSVDIARAAISYVYPAGKDLYDGQWHMLTYVLPPSATLQNIKVYFDGVRLTTQDYAVNVNIAVNTIINNGSNSSLNLSIGSFSSNASNIFLGGLDEFRFYNRALTDCEIRELFGTTPKFTSTPATPVCSGKAITYSVSSIIATNSYQWKIDNVIQTNVTGTSFTKTWQASEAGNRAISVAAVSTTCGTSASATATITVTAKPVVAAITGVNKVCVNNTTQLFNTTPNGVWTSSNTAIATVDKGASGALYVKGIAVGNVVITYTVTANGCSGSKIYNVSVNGVPPAFTIDGATPVCPGNFATYTVNPITANTRYYWVVDNQIYHSEPNGGSPTTQVWAPSTTQTYNVKAAGINNCGTYETSKSVSTTSDVPVDPNLTCSASNGTNDCPTMSVSNSTGYSVQWNVGGTIFNNVNTITRPVGANVTVQYTSASGCKRTGYRNSTTICKAYRLADEVDLPSDHSFKVYPNPSNGVFTIETSGQAGTASVIDVYGKTIQTLYLNEAQINYAVTLETKGTYIVKIKTSIETKGYKLVVE